MFSSPNASWLSGIAAPLTAKFGGDVRVSRCDNAVQWAYEGQSAVVELSPAGVLRATFIDSERVDAVTSAPAAAVYRAASSYGLNPSGCSRMVADLVDFFSGVREPRFRFIDAYPR